MDHPPRLHFLALGVLLVVTRVQALQICDIDHQPVNPNNGATTAGKTGLMRCRDADTGLVAREQELRDGKFVGLVRQYKQGQLERERSVDERGNRTGLSREWNVDVDGRRILIRQETYRDSSAIGLVRTWYPTGERRRVGFVGDDKREQAVVEFDPQGRLLDLRCAPQPVFGTDFDDRAACGHSGSVSTVVLVGGRNGEPVTRIAFERGERRRVESLGPGGVVREVRETMVNGSTLRRYSADGAVKLYEARWVAVLPAGALPGTGARPPRSVKVLEQEFHASGQLVQETRWTPPATEREPVELASESRWYLNGQPKQRVEYTTVDTVASTTAATAGVPRRLRRETAFHDNGRPASEGTWAIGRTDGPGDRFDRSERPIGTHRSFDESGRLRAESVYDDRGRLARERAFDEAGRPTRDEEVYEDGSRKSTAR